MGAEGIFTPQQEIIQKPNIDSENVKSLPLGEGVNKILGFLRRNKADINQNPNAVIKGLAEGIPDANINTPAPTQPEAPNSEQTALLERANNLLGGFAKVREILQNVKDNELASTAVVAGIGIVSALALGSEAQIAMDATMVAAGSLGGGTTQDKLRNVAVGAAGAIGLQGAEHLAGTGLDKAVEFAGGFSDMGKQFVKEAARNETIREVAKSAGSRMTRRTNFLNNKPQI